VAAIEARVTAFATLDAVGRSMPLRDSGGEGGEGKAGKVDVIKPETAVVLT
jgi:hypothetical protein